MWNNHSINKTLTIQINVFIIYKVTSYNVNLIYRHSKKYFFGIQITIYTL